MQILIVSTDFLFSGLLFLFMFFLVGFLFHVLDKNRVAKLFLVLSVLTSLVFILFLINNILLGV